MATHKVSILHVTFDMTIGGVQQVIRQIIENIDGEKFVSEIACLDNEIGELGMALSNKGYVIHLFDRQPGFDWILVRDLRRLIKNNHYQVIHCHQYTPYFYGLLASLFAGVKLIFTEHGRFYPDYGTYKRKLLNPVFSFFTEQIIAISSSTKDALVQYENFSPKKIRVIYNGVADSFQQKFDVSRLIEELGIHKDMFIFGTVSRLQPIKNQKLMINAFARIHEKYPQTHLLIVGDGEARKELEMLVSQLQLESSVTFTGFQKDPYRFYQIFDIVLLSSFSEGLSMTLIEAMAASRPAVVTNVGGNAEVVTDGENGLVVESDNVPLFTNAMEKSLINQIDLKVMGEHSRKKYLEQFSIENMVEKMMSIYIGK